MERPRNPLSAAVRQESFQHARQLGYSTNPTLPLLDVTAITRSAHEVASRALVLHACCAASYGFSLERAGDWLVENALVDHASPEEQRFLREGSNGDSFKLRPEAIWALCWVLKKAESFAVHRPMPQSAVALLPDIKKGEGAKAWLSHSTAVRESHDVLKALDFYYCVHWSLRDARLNGRMVSTTLPCYAVVERRRALEWCFSQEAWDHVPLDT